MDESEFKAVGYSRWNRNLLILGSRLEAKPNRPPINVIKHYGTLPLVYCHPAELNQVFLNLLTNAIDAIDELLVNVKTVMTEVPDVAPIAGEIRIETELKENSWVVIRISDNGKGIPQAIVPKLFDPFFTTKSVGQGTGLGLAVSYEIIVDKHQGQINASSEPGQGAELIVEIPLSPCP